MADSNIGALPLAPGVADDSLLVMEQQGTAMRLTGQMLKRYAKQGVELEFQDYLDEAKAAAERAAGAVEPVTGMTVEAHESAGPSVTKTTRNGRINLDFGLPRGERGEPGPAGETGPRGPQGLPGSGLKLLGHYDAEADLRAAVTAPEPGDAYSVGRELPYSTLIFDGVSCDWKNYGPLSGGGGEILPENMVTSEGGAVLELPAVFGDAPHTVAFTEEEEPPLTAGDVAYGDGTVETALDGLKASVSDGKALVASAITDKGVPTAQDAAFSELAACIGQIAAGSDTSDATASSADILAGKTAYTASGKVEGRIPSLAARTYIPGTAAQVIASGQYLSGNQTVQGDPNLTSSNIKKGASIFGVAGAVEQSFLATLTVTADVGAVVTAAHSGGTQVEALSVTGAVTLELSLEGQWTVTARRGVAQYNSVVIEVSSHYSAALTAEVHIVYYGTASALQTARYALAAAANRSFAVFAGGVPGASAWTDAVDSYNAALTHSTPTPLSQRRHSLAAAAYEDVILFAGGQAGSSYAAAVDRYSADLTRYEWGELSTPRGGLAGTAIGDYILFGGGVTADGASAAVDAYYVGATPITPESGLAIAAGTLKAASNASYGIFGSSGGTTAYDKNLVRTIAAGLAAAPGAAAQAGNYVLFPEINGSVEAYDLFLTRTTTEQLKTARAFLAGTTLNNHAVFAGGALNGVYSDAVDVYDPYLVHTTPKGLGGAWAYLSAVTIGDFALFGGGSRYLDLNSQYYSANVYAYQYV